MINNLEITNYIIIKIVRIYIFESELKKMNDLYLS